MQVKKIGRPQKKDNDKKKHRITFYLKDSDLKKLDMLKIGLIKHSPTLSLSEFFRLVVVNYDDGLIDYLESDPQSEVKRYMQSQTAYKRMFE